MASLKSLQKRYNTSLQNDDFYGAEQACRMIHHRLTTSKTSTAEDKQKAFETLLNGCNTLLEKSQPLAGAALALLAAKHCVEHKVPVDDSSISKFSALSSAFDSNPDNQTDEAQRERLRFLKAALAWSSTKDGSILGATRHGHPTLNTLVGHCSARVGDYKLSERAFVHSDDPKGYALVLYQYSKEQTLQGEVGLVLTRAVLRYLLCENLNDAIVFRKRFSHLAGWIDVEEGGSVSGSGIAEVPALAKFCEILVQIVRLDATVAPLYNRICETYQPQLERDPQFADQVARIGQMYFNIQPPQPAGIAGMMGTMLRGMMNSNNNQ